MNQDVNETNAVTLNPGIKDAVTQNVDVGGGVDDRVGGGGGGVTDAVTRNVGVKDAVTQNVGVKDAGETKGADVLGIAAWKDPVERRASAVALTEAIAHQAAERFERARRAEARAEGTFVSEASLNRKGAAKVALSHKVALSRRNFLAASTAGAAALALEGCIRRPEEFILPHSLAPEFAQPGIALHYATSIAQGEDVSGLVVASHEGRPTKIEGNPAHPANRGATDVPTQLEIWNLYDPDRAKRATAGPKGERKRISYAEADALFSDLRDKFLPQQGRGLLVLLEPHASPTQKRLEDRIKRRYPEATVLHYAPFGHRNERAGARLAFGAPARVVPQLQRAKRVLALDADFLGAGPGSVINARGFSSGRRPQDAKSTMNRLYVVEPGHSVTGSMADHRLRVRPSRVGAVALGVAQAVGVSGLASAQLSPEEEKFVRAVAADLRNTGVVLVGERQPAWVHALGHAINQALGANGPLVRITSVLQDFGDELDNIVAFSKALTNADTVIMIGGNPVFDAPSDLGINKKLARKDLNVIRVSSHVDESSEDAGLHIPLAHAFESWSDHRSAEGVHSIQQPLIAPLWGAWSVNETLARIAGERFGDRDQLIKHTHNLPAQKWRGALRDGVFRAPIDPAPNYVLNAAQLLSAAEASLKAESADFEVAFERSAALLDGRNANNLWALELPDPITKLVWDNAALVSRATARKLKLSDGDIVEISAAGKKLNIPALVVPGHADDAITIACGWGRKAAGRYGTSGEHPKFDLLDDAMNAGGVDGYVLRQSTAFDFVGATLRKTGKKEVLVRTQLHDRMEGRPIAIDATLKSHPVYDVNHVASWEKESAEGKSDFASYRAVEFGEGPLWTEVYYGPNDKRGSDKPYTGADPEQGRPARKRKRWGMSIDLSACTGCNACVVACQAENNIPAVGKREVLRGREMHWLRIDRYFIEPKAGTPDDEMVVSVQPVTCQQCEEAPCENVCPVNATSHTPEGLNDMAYNRCIGTRYCANNCPYKVRRFNYLDWHGHLDDPYGMHDKFPETRKMQFNPNVTVRMRGVMEKCTYCVQRIQGVMAKVKREKRNLRDGEIVSACQQVCPSSAIVFGDLNDPQSRLSLAVKNERGYRLLAELGTQPRTTFLAKIRNPNPELSSHNGVSDKGAQRPSTTVPSTTAPPTTAPSTTGGAEQHEGGAH